MKPEDLVGRRVRIWLGIGTRGEIRKGREKDRHIEGVVERHELFGFVVPAPDGRVPFVVDETRVLDALDEPTNQWFSVFDGRTKKSK